MTLMKGIMLAVLLSAAVLCDLRDYHVTNILTLGGAAAGILSGLATGGRQGLINSLLGWLVPVGLLFILHVFSMIGAGDIKLLAAAGCFIGPQDIAMATAASFVIGAAIAAVRMLRKGIFARRFRYLIGYCAGLVRYRTITPYEGKEHTGNAHLIHFTIPIAIAVVIVMTVRHVS